MTRTLFAIRLTPLLALFALLWMASPAAAQGEPQNLRITVRLIEADGFTEVDPSISGIVEELQDLFRFDGYRLLTDATVLMTAPLYEDESAAQRIAPSVDKQFEIGIQLSPALQIVDGSPTRDPDSWRLHFSLLDGRPGYDFATILDAGLRVRVGQTVVLGSSQYRPDQPTLIIALLVEGR